jgi:hypothetical protein
MVNGLPPIAAAVVINRKKPSWVIRENAIRPVSSSHHRWAVAEWTCSGAARASQTLTSGKLKEFIDLFVGKIEPPSGGRNQRRVEAESPTGTRRFGLLDRVFDTGENKLAGRTALSRRDLM